MQTFDGADYQPTRDDARLTVQFDRIFALMRDGVPRTLAQIEYATNAPAASASAQLRHMRKPRFGQHTVTREYVGKGLYTYQLTLAGGGA